MSTSGVVQSSAAPSSLSASASPTVPPHTQQQQQQQQQQRNHLGPSPPLSSSPPAKVLPSSPSILFRQSGFLPTYKVLLMGDAAVGKTSLLGRYCRNEYDPYAPPTIGIEFFSREIEVPTGRVGEVQRVVAQIWDTAGQERCSAISNAYYRNAVGAMLVYDVARRDTFLDIPRWAAQVSALASETCVCVVVGNKTDLPETAWAVTAAEGEELAHSLGMRHCLASAFNGHGVLHAFTQMILAVNAQQMLQLYERQQQQQQYSGNGGGENNNNHNSNNGNISSNNNSSSGRGEASSGGCGVDDHSNASGHVVTRALRSTYFSPEENTMWTVPSTVPQGQLSTGSPTSPPTTTTATTTAAAAVVGPGGIGGGYAGAYTHSYPPQQQQQQQRLPGMRGGSRRTLDLRGFGSGGGTMEEEDLSFSGPVGGGGGGCC